jgi:uncharacterized protein YjbI with pentapeptide repeats
MPVMLVEASLRFARLESAILHEARLEGADLTGARIDADALSDEQRGSILSRAAAA